MRTERKTGSGGAKALAGAVAAFALAHGGAANAETLRDICGDCQAEKYVTCGQFLEGVNVDRDGVMWAVSLMSGDILRVADGKCETVAKTGGRPNGSRFHADGRLFITDNVRGILAFDTRTKAITVIADKVAGTPIVNANDLVFDQKGGFYVTEPGTSNFLERTGRFLYFPPDGGEGKVLATGLAYPNGVAISSDGLYVDVGMYGAKTVITFPSQLNPNKVRSVYASVITEGGVGPDGMARDAKGRLFWAEFNAGAVGVTDNRDFVLGYIKLPDEAGRWTTNLTFHDGWLYITEATKGDIWRVKVATTGADLSKLN